MLNYSETILSQYAASPTLTALIESFNDCIDPTADLDAFYSNIWDMQTAVGNGLDIWGRIVGIKRVLQVSAGQWLGYEEAGDGSVETPFNVAPLYDGSSTTGNYALTDDAFRLLIQAKAYANISNGSIQSINQILMALFGSTGDCWCTDGQNMTMTYTFDFQLSPVQFAIVAQSGVLPRPAGVQLSIVQLGLYDNGGVVGIEMGTSGYPTSPTGLTNGALWNNAGVVSVYGTTTPNPSAPPVYFSAINATSLLRIGGANLPLTNQGIGSGILWNDGGVVAIS
jgi:hypothetical protein